MQNSRLATALLAAAMSFGMLSSAFAQDSAENTSNVDTHLEAAVAVVEQTGNVPSFEAQLALITKNSKNILIRQNPGAEKDIIATVDEVAERYKDRRILMVQAMAVSWASYLKEDELKEVLAFFKTETGQKFANYQPRILGESLGEIQKLSADFTQVIIKHSKEELAKKGHKFP